MVVDLETGGFDATGTLLAAVVRGSGDERAVLIGLGDVGRFMGFTGNTPGVLASAPSPSVPSFVTCPIKSSTEPTFFAVAANWEADSRTCATDPAADSIASV